MDIIKLITQTLAITLGCLTAVMSILLFVRLRWPALVFWFLKLYVSALSTLLALISMVSCIVGLFTGSIFIISIGAFGTLVFAIHIIRVTRPPDPSNSFEKAFGLNWEKQLKPEQKNYFLPGRLLLKLPVVPNPRMQQNISFATIPRTGRQLLCDIWQPPKGIRPSGLAFIYLHGSAFYFLDKDFFTRSFFSHLAAQGHVIMDVAYRLSPETDMMGMVNDAKRAIAWMRDNADTYKINPARIVIGGGSAGGHLALLTAYTANNPRFTPRELEGKVLSVTAVISLYGTSDMEALYYHTNQHLTTRSVPGRQKKSVPTKMPSWIVKKMGTDYHRLGMDKGFENTGTLAPLLGGHPDECPEQYKLFSVAKHVHSGCPPTLLIHGEDDIMAPVKSTRFLYTRLIEKDVPTVMHILPQTDHAFDLILPKISPSAHNAIYDVERFLGLITFQSQALAKRGVLNIIQHSN
ncbi:MAG TPA: alpha/beta hydrolase [Chitinophagaceae bacterium]|nr:alpha/beta hydrolase [Chitinophagaceae bacterium]